MPRNLNRPPPCLFAVSLVAIALLAGCGGAPTTTQAQGDSADSTPGAEQEAGIAGLAQEATEDRMTELRQLAQDAPAVSVYTSVAVSEVEAMVEAFEAEHGVEVEIYRALMPEVASRVGNELTAGRPGYDVIWANGQGMTALEREEAYTPFVSAFEDGFSEDLISSDLWYPVDVNYWTWAFNTDLLTPAEAPSNYESLTDPQWRGRFSLARYPDWLATVWDHMGDERAQEFFTQLAANEPFVTQPSFTLAQELVQVGEMEFTISSVSSIVQRQQVQGAPIEGYFPQEPTVARPNGVGWTDRGPNAAGGLLFAEFILSPEGGQSVLREVGRVPAHEDIAPDPPSLEPDEFVTVDFEAYIEEQEQWEQRWDEIFGRDVAE